MFAIAHDTILRDSLAGLLQLASERVFSTYRPPPVSGNLVVGIEDVGEGNLRFAVRYFLANAEKNIKLFVVKRHWTEAEEARFEELVRTEYRRAHDLNQKAIDRINKLPDCEWKSERLEQLSEWKTIPTISHTLLTLNDNLKSEIDALVRIAHCTISEDSASLTSKPPVLHWTADPLEGEVQFIVQFTFPLVGPDQTTYREICRSLKPHADSTYEWIGGILLTTDPIRLHVQRYCDTVIEFVARICVDELEGEEASKPMRLVWPYLAIALKQCVQILAEHPHLQYSMTFVPFGAPFYTPELESRLFDATIFSATATVFQKLGFRVGNDLYAVNVENIFPDGPYKSLSHLLSLTPPSPRLSRSQSDIDVATSPSPLPEVSSHGSGLTVSHNRGRRVSFGTIKLMSETTTVNNGVVDEYVERMLQTTIDQLAV
ncbi:unnamed protein product [Caenorhabditis auriculariae]|uniref:Uncharacterized protein n=1 Tax=Caenorhabditis auriculariae TaxID=2777116 RepID=A0A8S1HRJ2_9PELO|nr:unnamed protein product [Caenorhabditis auriculariae]